MVKLIANFFFKLYNNSILWIYNKVASGKGQFKNKLFSIFIILCLKKPICYMSFTIGFHKSFYIIFSALTACIILFVLNEFQGGDKLTKSNYFFTFILNIMCITFISFGLDILLAAKLDWIILDVIVTIFFGLVAWCHESFFKLTDKLGLNSNFKSQKLYMEGIEDDKSINSSPRKLNLLELYKKGKEGEGTSELPNSKDSDSSSVASGSSSNSSNSITERINKTVGKIIDVFTKIREHTAEALSGTRDNATSSRVASSTEIAAGTTDKGPSRVASSTEIAAGTSSKAPTPAPRAIPSSYWDRGGLSWGEFTQSVEGKVANKRVEMLLKKYGNSYRDEYEKNFYVIFKITNSWSDSNIIVESPRLIELKKQLIEDYAYAVFKGKYESFREEYYRNPRIIPHCANHYYFLTRSLMDLWISYSHHKAVVTREFLEVFDKDLRESITREEYEEKYSRAMGQLKSNLDKHHNKYTTNNSLILKELEKLKISKMP